MSSIINKYSSYLILLLCCIPLFFLNIHDTHFWGDDYAQYIKEALNIANGRQYYQSNYVFNELNTDFGPPQYPPGYPLLLALVVKIWGIAIRPMLYLNAVFLSGLLFTFFAYFKKHTSETVAICIALIGVYCGFSFDVKQTLYSDLPCTLFVSLYFLFRKSDKINFARVGLLIFIATMAILIRTQAILVIISEIIYLLILNIKLYFKTKTIDKNNVLSPSFYVSIGTIILYSLVSHFIFYTPASTFHYYAHMAESMNRSRVTLIDDIYYFKALFGSAFWYYYTQSLTDPFSNVAIDLSYLSCFLGFLMVIRKRVAVEDIFFILMCLIIFAVPVRQGFRLLYPAFMIILFYCYTSISAILFYTLNVKGKTAAITLTIFYLLIGHNVFKLSIKINTDNTPYGKDDLSAFSYLSGNIKDSDIIIFTKPRALTLYTGKRGMVAAPQLSYEENKLKFDAVKARYMLINKLMDYDWYIGYLNKTHSAIDSYRINSTYMLYSLAQ